MYINICLESKVRVITKIHMLLLISVYCVFPFHLLERMDIYLDNIAYLKEIFV